MAELAEYRLRMCEASDVRSGSGPVRNGGRGGQPERHTMYSGSSSRSVGWTKDLRLPFHQSRRDVTTGGRRPRRMLS